MWERLNKPQLSEMNNNFYFNESEEISDTIISWSPAYNEKCEVKLISPDELTTLYPDFENESKVNIGTATSIFNNYSNNDFNIKAENKEMVNGVLIPEEISSLLKLKDKKAAFAGAYYLK